MQPGWGPRPVPTTDGKAIAALVLGIVCLVGAPCWLGLPVGVPAVVLGILAHRDIRRASGMTGGTGLATAGIVLGTLGSLFFLTTVGFLVFAFVHHSPTIPTLPPPVAVAPTATPTAPTVGIVPPGGWGVVHVVEVHPDPSRTLADQLAGEAKAARATGETVLVETIGPACEACAEIARAVRDPRLQATLARVRLVLLDVTEMKGQLAKLHFDQPGLPWFYLVDARGLPRDGISADEWDDNVAENIAPVLEAFLTGHLSSRATPWRAGTSL